MQRRKKLAVLTSITLALVLVGPGASVAQADAFGTCSTTTGCLPDNFEHTFCWSGTYTAAFYNAATYGMTNLDSQSNYYDTRVSCTSTTDVVFEQTTGFSARGDYLCTSFNSAGECERSRVRLNPTYLTNTANRQKTACHEVGHSGGLSHVDGGTDCMRNGSITSGYQTYNAHHVAHLNNRS